MSKKEQIRAAAVKVIASEGFFNATTDKIAKEAGVAVGTLYNYFSSKEDILNHIYDVEYQKRYRLYQEIKNRQIDPLAKIKELLFFHFQEIQKEPDIVKIVLAEKINAGRHKLISFEKFAKLPVIISEIINEGIAKGYLKKCDSRIISIMMFGFIEAIMTEFLVTQNKEILEKALEEICYLLEEGLRI
jgi:TetR/AcrR family fatty acid metabolism transcriptional regulator